MLQDMHNRRSLIDSEKDQGLHRKALAIGAVLAMTAVVAATALRDQGIPHESPFANSEPQSRASAFADALETGLANTGRYAEGKITYRTPPPSLGRGSSTTCGRSRVESGFLSYCAHLPHFERYGRSDHCRSH